MCSLSRGHIGLPNDVNTVSYFVGAERTHISQRETFNNAQRYISTFYYLYMPLSSRISMLRHSSISQPRTVLTVTCFASNCAQILVSFLCKHCRCQAIKHSGEHERWNQALRLWREHPADWLDGKLVRRYSLLYGCKFSLPLLSPPPPSPPFPLSSFLSFFSLSLSPLSFFFFSSSPPLSPSLMPVVHRDLINTFLALALYGVPPIIESY